MISSEPIGRGESYYARIWAKFVCIHSAIKFKLSWIFGWQFLKSYISKTGRAFDQILNLTAGPYYQLSPDRIWLASRCWKQMVIFIKEKKM